MTTENFKGLVVFWVNLHPDMGQDTITTLGMIREMNKPLLEYLATEDGRYRFLFVPTFKESTRIEKIDFDEPYPRCMAGSLPFKAQVSKKSSPDLLTGVITMFINFSTEMDVDVAETLNLIREVNKEIFEEIEKNAGYKVLMVPTTKEGSRIEKIDWDLPFPRIVPGRAVEEDEDELEDGDDE